jgi:hypothetical protein
LSTWKTSLLHFFYFTPTLYISRASIFKLAKMYSTIVVLSALSALAGAAPPPPVGFPALPLGLANMIPKFIPAPPPGSCPLTNVAQPSNTLPTVDSGLKLELVAIGRGTQNYTCATNTADSVPVAAGALATLFNASCIASHMSDTVLQQITQGAEKVSASSIPLQNIGEHFFVDATTPTFVISDLGTTESKKNATVAAPTNTNGNVAWLKLLAQTTGTTTTIKNIYRLNTVGGSAPSNCSGMSPTFTVQYAADYFFYSSS